MRRVILILLLGFNLLVAITDGIKPLYDIFQQEFELTKSYYYLSNLKKTFESKFNRRLNDINEFDSTVAIKKFLVSSIVGCNPEEMEKDINFLIEGFNENANGFYYLLHKLEEHQIPEGEDIE
jgi:hypothetical protein